jgi:hypothetical protein
VAGLLIAFALGVAASVAAAWVVEYGARPSLRVGNPQAWGIRRQFPKTGGGFEQAAFYHLLVRNVRRRFGLLGPRAAWACHASIELTAEAGGFRILPIDGRWSAHPEPVAPAAGPSGQVLLLDHAKILTGRRIDVHGHMPLELCIAIKFEGEADCYLFNNDSYVFARWQNPAWRFGLGDYRLRVTLSSEVGRDTFEFRLRNVGSSRDDLHLEAIS